MDLQDWLLEHHRDSYRYQLEQGDKVMERVAFWSSPLTVLGGAIIYVFAHYRGDGNAWFCGAFYFLIGLATASFLLAMALMLVAVFPRRYFSVLGAKKLQEYVSALLAQNQPIEVLRKTKEQLLTRYSHAAAANRDINERRNKLIRHGAWASVVSLISFAVALYPFFRSASV